MVDVVLVPGLWLDGSSWERVVPVLQRAGHRAHPITLPGMESRDTDRSGVGLRDAVDAVVAVVDACEGEVAMVGHSAGAGIAYAAVDARPDRVVRAIYVGGFPTGDGSPVVRGFETDRGDLPMPDWSAFGPEDLTDLDDQALAAFRDRAIPSPARLGTDLQQLTDPRRYDVPTTVICPEFTAEALRGWVAADEPPVRELARIHSVDYIDLPTGHWPQFTRPTELAQTILQTLPSP